MTFRQDGVRICSDLSTPWRLSKFACCGHTPRLSPPGGAGGATSQAISSVMQMRNVETPHNKTNKTCKLKRVEDAARNKTHFGHVCYTLVSTPTQQKSKANASRAQTQTPQNCFLRLAAGAVDELEAVVDELGAVELRFEDPAPEPSSSLSLSRAPF